MHRVDAINKLRKEEGKQKVVNGNRKRERKVTEVDEGVTLQRVPQVSLMSSSRTHTLSFTSPTWESIGRILALNTR